MEQLQKERGDTTLFFPAVWELFWEMREKRNSFKQRGTLPLLPHRMRSQPIQKFGLGNVETASWVFMKFVIFVSAVDIFQKLQREVDKRQNSTFCPALTVTYFKFLSCHSVFLLAIASPSSLSVVLVVLFFFFLVI